MSSPEPLARLLAFLRSRLLGAVLMPALLGAAWAARQRTLPPARLLLVLTGLAAAELMNLFGADYAAYRAAARTGPRPTAARRPLLPGNPVVRPSRLPPARIPLALAALALAGLAVMLYFALAVGPAVLLFFLAAALVGVLYVLEPFPGAFLSTAAIPPLISGGTALALSGAALPGSFLAGLPVAWVSAAVILGYRWAQGAEGPQGPARRGLVLSLFLAAGCQVLALWLAGVFPPAALAAIPVILAFGGLAVWAGRRRPADPVPATALGVLAHTLGSLVLAAALAWG